MANRYSKVQSSIWSSKKFKSVKEGFAKLVYMYLLSCPHGNSAGLFHLPTGYATTDLECTKEEFEGAIKMLMDAQLITYHDSVVFIRQFLKINPYNNKKHARGSWCEVSGYVNSPLYKEFYNDIKTYCHKYLDEFETPKSCIETISEQQEYGIETVSKPYQHQTKPDQDHNQDHNHNQDKEFVPSGTDAELSVKAKVDPYRDLFEHYLSLELVKHRELTTEMRNAIDTARRRGGYTWDELKKLLDRHAMVVKLTAGSGEYRVRARPLVEFFGQKVKDGTALICSEYADDGSKWQRYRNGNPNNATPEQPSKYSKDI